MTEKPNWLPPKDYKEKISNLLNNVSSSVPKKIEPVVKPEPTMYEKLKPLGIKNGLVELFKLEEAYEVPRFVTEETEEESSELVKVSPPSSYPDCDEFWNSIKSHLKHIGSPLKYVVDQSGLIQTKVNNDSGKEEILEIKLLRDTQNGDKPYLGFNFQGPQQLESSELVRYLGSVGLKFDRVGIKTMGNMLVVEIII